MRILLISDMHLSTADRLGYTQAQRLEKMMDCLKAENDAHPLEAILLLGDMSIDDYGFRNLSVNYCEKFKNDYLLRFPAPTYVIAGNHDSYPDAVWRSIFSTPRQYSVRIGNAAFIMADTFNGLARDAGGAPYTPADMDFVRAEYEKYPDGPVFLCAHYFDEARESDELRAFVRESRIRALIQGHTHRAETRRLSDAFGGKPLIDIGCFSYYTKPTNGVWDFDVFDEEYAWGYQLLDIDGRRIETRHVAVPVFYRGSNVSCDYPGRTTEPFTL